MSKTPLPPTHQASIHEALVPNGTFTIHVGGFRITRRGRFWTVRDSRDALIVTAVYKKGALEVVRRLLPAEFRHLVDELQLREKTLKSASGSKPVTRSKSPGCRYDVRQP